MKLKIKNSGWVSGKYMAIYRVAYHVRVEGIKVPLMLMSRHANGDKQCGQVTSGYAGIRSMSNLARISSQ